MPEQKQIVNCDLTVEQLIEQLQKIKDKSKWVYLTGTGFLTSVDEACDYVEGEDQSVCIGLHTSNSVVI